MPCFSAAHTATLPATILELKSGYKAHCHTTYSRYDVLTLQPTRSCMDGDNISLQSLTRERQGDSSPNLPVETADDERQTFSPPDNAANDGEHDSGISRDTRNSSSQKPSPKDSGLTLSLQHSSHALVFFILFAILAIFTWVLTCILTFRPLTTRTYAFDVYDERTLGEVQASYMMNDNLYQAVRIFQCIVAVLTIPATSAICAGAAVVFTQRNKHSARMTLRQTMVLADKG